MCLLRRAAVSAAATVGVLIGLTDSTLAATKLEKHSRYLGIEVDDALEMAEQTEV